MAIKQEADLDFQSAKRVSNLPKPVADAEPMRRMDGPFLLASNTSPGGGPSVTFDGIFDSSKFASYLVDFWCRPASDNVSLQFDLRTSTPADLGASWFHGAHFARSGAAGETKNESSTATIVTSVGNVSGGTLNEGVHNCDFRIRPHGTNDSQTTAFKGFYGAFSASFWAFYGGNFADDSTDCTGIRFFWSSGNFSDGEFFVYGYPRG